ncbi:hypothetical protein ACN3XK_27915 [Actinomadura welshii]
MLVFAVPGGRRCVCAGSAAAPFPTPGEPVRERNAAGPAARAGGAAGRPAAGGRGGKGHRGKGHRGKGHRGDRRPARAARGAGERG